MKTGAHKLSKLYLVKLLHTLVWIFFNGVLFYLFYAVASNQIGIWVWAGIALIILEGITLLIFGMKCPLTVIAKKYSSSTKPNFDIFLPEWLAKNNKLIYSILFGIIVIILVYQLINK